MCILCVLAKRRTQGAVDTKGQETETRLRVFNVRNKKRVANRTNKSPRTTNFLKPGLHKEDAVKEVGGKHDGP